MSDLKDLTAAVEKGNRKEAARLTQALLDAASAVDLAHQLVAD